MLSFAAVLVRVLSFSFALVFVSALALGFVLLFCSCYSYRPGVAVSVRGFAVCIPCCPGAERGEQQSHQRAAPVLAGVDDVP